MFYYLDIINLLELNFMSLVKVEVNLHVLCFYPIEKRKRIGYGSEIIKRAYRKRHKRMNGFFQQRLTQRDGRD